MEEVLMGTTVQYASANLDNVKLSIEINANSNVPMLGKTTEKV